MPCLMAVCRLAVMGSPLICQISIISTINLIHYWLNLCQCVDASVGHKSEKSKQHEPKEAADPTWTWFFPAKPNTAPLPTWHIISMPWGHVYRQRYGCVLGRIMAAPGHAWPCTALPYYNTLNLLILLHNENTPALCASRPKVCDLLWASL